MSRPSPPRHRLGRRARRCRRSTPRVTATSPRVAVVTALTAGVVLLDRRRAGRQRRHRPALSSTAARPTSRRRRRLGAAARRRSSAAACGGRRERSRTCTAPTVGRTTAPHAPLEPGETRTVDARRLGRGARPRTFGGLFLTVSITRTAASSRVAHPRRRPVRRAARCACRPRIHAPPPDDRCRTTDGRLILSNAGSRRRSPVVGPAAGLVRLDVRDRAAARSRMLVLAGRRSSTPRSLGLAGAAASTAVARVRHVPGERRGPGGRRRACCCPVSGRPAAPRPAPSRWARAARCRPSRSWPRASATHERGPPAAERRAASRRHTCRSLARSPCGHVS